MTRCERCRYACSSCGLPPDQPLAALGWMIVTVVACLGTAFAWWLALSLLGGLR